MPNNKNDFKPYIPADRVVPEFTVTSILIGVLLAIIFGAANAYLGLRGKGEDRTGCNRLTG